MLASLDLTGRVAIVTGGSRGIGEAIAGALVAHGAKVVVAARKADGLAQVADALGAACVPMVANTGREAECVRLVAETVEKLGQVDILVNNAATNLHFGSMLDVDMGAWDKTFDVNVKGYFWMTREVVRHLQARGAGGSIIQVASVAGTTAAPLQGMYGMTKAAVISMTQTLAFELAGGGIRVNALVPGLVETRLAAGLLNNEPLMEQLMQRTPLGRPGQPSELAGAALFLASDASSYMTGQTLIVDGGMRIG